MNHAVEREQKNLVGSERRVRELTLRVEGVTQIDGDVERGIKELTEVASEIGRLKKTRVSCILKPHLPQSNTLPRTNTRNKDHGGGSELRLVAASSITRFHCHYPPRGFGWGLGLSYYAHARSPLRMHSPPWALCVLRSGGDGTGK